MNVLFESEDQSKTVILFAAEFKLQILSGLMQEHFYIHFLNLSHVLCFFWLDKLLVKFHKNGGGASSPDVRDQSVVVSEAHFVVIFSKQLQNGGDVSIESFNTENLLIYLNID